MDNEKKFLDKDGLQAHITQTKKYVDDAETSAKDYADSQDTALKTAIEGGDTDTVYTKTIKGAKDFAAAKATAAVNTAKAYADGIDAKAQENLKAVQANLSNTQTNLATTQEDLEKLNFILNIDLFKKIFNEYGSAGLKKAIKATRLHIDYRKSCGHTVDSIEEACDKAEARL